MAMFNNQLVYWFNWDGHSRNPNSRYLRYIRPIAQGYVRGYSPKIWPYMVQYLHFRILDFPLIIWFNWNDITMYVMLMMIIMG